MAENIDPKLNIGEKLRKLRLLKGIKKIEVLVGRANQGVTDENKMLTTPYVYRLESGAVKSPGIEILSRYAKGLNMTVGELTDYITGAKKISGVTPIHTISELANTLMIIDERYGTVEIPVVGHIPTTDEINVDKSIDKVYIHKALISDGGIDAMRIVIADDDALASEGIYKNYNLIYNNRKLKLKDGQKYLVKIKGETYAAILSKYGEDMINVRRFNKTVQIPVSEVQILGLIEAWGFWKTSNGENDPESN